MNTSCETHDRSGPLAGVRVVEMGSLIAGPFAGQLLGDYGADVIKIEPPGAGDPMRDWGVRAPDGRGLWWPTIARNKRSMTLDLRVSAGQEVARALLAHADVLVENFRPGTLDRWGLGYDVLSVANPGIVVTHVSGYGQDGPYSSRAGFGSVAEAMGGVRHTTGNSDRPSTRTGISLGDSLAATFAVIGTLAALTERSRTGRGQQVDVAIYEAVFALMESTIADHAVAGVTRARSGSVLPGIAPSNVYPTADGADVLIAANADTVFGRLAALMEAPELASDPRFAAHHDRGANAAELDAMIADWTRRHPADELLRLLDEAGVPAGRINTAADILADPHFAARQMIQWRRLAGDLELPMSGVVPRFSRTPGDIAATGPALGEHTDDVLRTLCGYDEHRIRQLHADGVV